MDYWELGVYFGVVELVWMLLFCCYVVFFECYVVDRLSVWVVWFCFVFRYCVLVVERCILVCMCFVMWMLSVLSCMVLLGLLFSRWMLLMLSVCSICVVIV